MSDTEPTDVPEEAAPAEPPAPPVEPPAPPVVRTRQRDLVFGLRSLVAVALAGVILGGLAGYAINAGTGGDDHQDGRMGRFGPGGGFPGGPQGGGFPGGPGQGPGQQLPPQGGIQQAPSQAPTASPS
jgi:hypothetical protein